MIKIPVGKPSIGNKEIDYVNQALKSGWVSSRGEFIEKFEREFAKFCGTKFAVSCNNGTSALHLALIALNIKNGDEVIVPALTYIATANAVKYVNAEPVLVDVSKDNFGIDTEKIEEKITSRTKAIIAVHLYGIPCDIEKIMDIARKNNLRVIEDCAEAHGAEVNGKKVGSFGDIACFSFYGNKIMTTGEGGMCLTNDEKLKEKMELIRNQGMHKTRKYWHEEIGNNFRMTNIQAAIGLAQLEQLEDFLKTREKHEEIYKNCLKNINGIGFVPKKENIKNVYWMHSIFLENKEKVMEELEKEGIETRPFFVTLNKMPPYYSKESFPVSDEISKKGINLPSSSDLKEDEIRFVCERIREFLGK